MLETLEKKRGRRLPMDVSIGNYWQSFGKSQEGGGCQWMHPSVSYCQQLLEKSQEWEGGDCQWMRALVTAGNF